MPPDFPYLPHQLKDSLTPRLTYGRSLIVDHRTLVQSVHRLTQPLRDVTPRPAGAGAQREGAGSLDDDKQDLLRRDRPRRLR